MKPCGSLIGAKILIVEDEPAISALLEAAVSAADGTIVGPATDISGALSLLRTRKIDAAILDMIVAGIYCDEIAHELHSRNIPYAITTGIGADESHPQLQAALSITKPFQAEYVQSVLAGMLARRSAEPTLK
ncbi:response regulator [Novosphingobium sp. G106]|uniref:response regulator n=1 Tax=Novosphingobium sp. G106 TaxID=2849500 RepID=UPI001C2CCF4D|nr:response regulator [Novosphingobium sp. G106]MBV1690413.1 response regulator [Novosphingobium sp. G106]